MGECRAPPPATRMVDWEAVRLLREWIAHLPPEGPAPAGRR